MAKEIRGHHIDTLRGYVLENSMWQKSIYLKMDEKKNRGFANKIEQYFNDILRNKTPITVIDDYDHICNECKNKAEGGCNKFGFSSSEKLAKLDREVASKWGLQIGKTYESSEFLRKINIFSDDCIDVLINPKSYAFKA